VAELLEDARRAAAQTETCTCPDDPHHNTLHDLAHDLVDFLTRAGADEAEVDARQTDRLIENISRALRTHPDARVVTGAGGERALFTPEADRLARIVLRIVGSHLASAVEPPGEDSMATDEDLAVYMGMQRAADVVRALTEGGGTS